MIKVRAADGLRVPTEHNPHEYIAEAVVEIDENSLYYRRALADGDLVAVDTKSAKTGKAETKEAE